MSRFRPAGFRNGRTAWRRASRRDSGRPGTVRWHRATDLPLPPTVKRRSAGRPPPIGETAFRGAAGFREARRDAVHPSRNALLRARVLEVRIHLPPANSPSLARFLLPVSKSRQLPRRARARPGGTAGRDAQNSSTSRQPPVISLSGPIPVPQCRLGGSRAWFHWHAKRGRVRVTKGLRVGPAQAKPSTARCSRQVSGRRECASSLSAVRSRG